MNKLQNLQMTGKRVLLRVDFNVPLNEKGELLDATRIEAALPTIQYILDQGASLVLMSHLGRPKGKREVRYSLKPCADYLRKRLQTPLFMAEDCIGTAVKQQVETLQPGESLLLENLRFYEAEEDPEKDPSFAQQLAQWGDLYVNDAFGTAHRKHSSTYTIAQYFPDKKAAGLLFEKEVAFLGQALQTPVRPFYALVGGAKISSKLGVLHALLDKVEALFLGGAMANTFLAAHKIPMGASLFEPDLQQEALALCEQAQKEGVALFLPIDMIVTSGKETRTVTVKEGCHAEEACVDIGPATVALYGEQCKKCKTIFWNGPFGKYEEERFAQGTLELLKIFSSLDAITIIGGGDLVAAATKGGYTSHISHVSTGGGASLEYIEQGSLPAIEVL